MRKAWPTQVLSFLREQKEEFGAKRRVGQVDYELKVISLTELHFDELEQANPLAYLSLSSIFSNLIVFSKK